MDALELASADDDIGDGGAVVEDEDGVLASSIVVGVAITAAVKLLVAVVDRAGDDGGRRKGDDGPRAGGDVEGLGGAQGSQ